MPSSTEAAEPILHGSKSIVEAKVPPALIVVPPYVNDSSVTRISEGSKKLKSPVVEELIYFQLVLQMEMLLLMVMFQQQHLIIYLLTQIQRL